MANSTSTTSNRVSSDCTGLVVVWTSVYWQTWKATIARAARPR